MVRMSASSLDTPENHAQPGVQGQRLVSSQAPLAMNQSVGASSKVWFRGSRDATRTSSGRTGPPPSTWKPRLGAAMGLGSTKASPSWMGATRRAPSRRSDRQKRSVSAGTNRRASASISPRPSQLRPHMAPLLVRKQRSVALEGVPPLVVDHVLVPPASSRSSTGFQMPAAKLSLRTRTVTRCLPG